MLTESNMEGTTLYNMEGTTLSNPVVNTFRPNATYALVSDYYKSWNYNLRVISLLIFTVIGSIGSMLSFLVFVKSKLRLSSHGAYLMALALVDPVILIIELLLRTNKLSYSHASCKAFYYIRNSLKMLECFLVLSLCIDRAVCLRFPFKSHKCSNLRVAVFAIFAQTMVSCGLCLYTLWQIVLYGVGCNHTPHDKDYNFVYTWTNFAVSSVIEELLTGIAVALLAAYIRHALLSLRQRARRLSRNKQPASEVDREVTRMTIAVAVAFSLFRLPYSTIYIVFFVRHFVLSYRYLSQSQIFLQKVVDVSAAVAYINYCINFFIYFVFWRAFRDKLLNMLCCGSDNSNERRRSSTSRRLTESTGFY